MHEAPFARLGAREGSGGVICVAVNAAVAYAGGQGAGEGRELTQRPDPNTTTVRTLTNQGLMSLS